MLGNKEIVGNFIVQGMRRSKILEERRKRVPLEVRETVALSFRIVDKIHEVLEEKGLNQKDFALRLGKCEAEISIIPVWAFASREKRKSKRHYCFPLMRVAAFRPINKRNYY